MIGKPRAFRQSQCSTNQPVWPQAIRQDLCELVCLTLIADFCLTERRGIHEIFRCHILELSCMRRGMVRPVRDEAGRLPCRYKTSVVASNGAQGSSFSPLTTYLQPFGRRRRQLPTQGQIHLVLCSCTCRSVLPVLG